MGKATITLEAVERAIAFLERRREHATLQKNREWTEEFENAIAVIKMLSAYERNFHTKSHNIPGAGCCGRSHSMREVILRGAILPQIPDS